jgi:GH24 family phage-related lysozyme (muramidase)|tara:strand:+ start:219 stop:854 length:636 start_codon:yes stop_codon:yes gene_type:complete
MIYDKRKGSLLNYIQLPLHVITPTGTYLGTGYDTKGKPTYILSHVKVNLEDTTTLTFSSMSKNAIILDNKPTLTVTDNIVGYNYKVSNTETNYGYITVAGTRIDIESKKITKPMAEFILEKQLRNIGNILEKFIKVKISQPHYDALLYHFYNEGTSTIENSPVIALINAKDWYAVTDEIQTDLMKNGRVDDKIAQRKIKTAKMFSYVPSFS